MVHLEATNKQAHGRISHRVIIGRRQNRRSRIGSQAVHANRKPEIRESESGKSKQIRINNEQKNQTPRCIVVDLIK